MQAWRAALTHDPAYAAARAALTAGLTGPQQADALWRPSVAVQAGAGLDHTSSVTRGAHFSAPGFGNANDVIFATSTTLGAVIQAGVEARQPLIDQQRSAEEQQLRLSTLQAQASWADAQSELMLRTAQNYLDLALGIERLRLINGQLSAVTRAQTEAQDRFKAGDIPITGVHEATARAQALRATQLAAQAQLERFRATLTNLTGIAQPDATGMALPAQLPNDAEVGTLPAWLERTAQSSFAVRAAQLGVQVAQQQARKSSGMTSPAIDLIARANHQQGWGAGSYGTPSNRQTQGMIGVQITLPLDIGGGRSAQHAQAVALIEQAQAQLDQARQNATEQARSAWLGVSVGRAQVAALQAAAKASAARLDATHTGFQVGDRTTLDVLNAENDNAAAQLALIEARVQVQMDGLRLAKLAGVLDEDRLQRLQAQLRVGKSP
jgi:outer membrane protein